MGLNDLTELLYCRILKINENKMITIINDDDFGIKTIGREANTFILKGLSNFGCLYYTKSWIWLYCF